MLGYTAFPFDILRRSVSSTATYRGIANVQQAADLRLRDVSCRFLTFSLLADLPTKSSLQRGFIFLLMQPGPCFVWLPCLKRFCMSLEIYAVFGEDCAFMPIVFWRLQRWLRTPLLVPLHWIAQEVCT